MDDGPYFLTRRIIGPSLRLPITQNYFDELKTAHANVAHATRIEEEWEAVLQNYLDLEKTLLEAAARNMVVRDFDHFTFHDSRVRFAVRLSNLLASCKSYVDHTAHHLNEIDPQESYAASFTTLRNEEHAKRFGYQMMEALRAHAQHRGFPIHSASYNSSWVEGQEGGLLSHSVGTTINVSILRQDKKFKKSLLDGLDDEHLEAEPLVRDYIEGLSAVHVATRKLYDDALIGWKQAIRDAISRYALAATDGSVVGLNAIELSAPHTIVRSVPLFEEHVALLERYQRRNGPLVNFAKRFVTSAPKLKRRTRA